MKTITTTFTLFLLFLAPYIQEVTNFKFLPDYIPSYIVSAEDGDEVGGADQGDEVGGAARSTKVVNPLTIDNIEQLLALILKTVVQVAIPFLVLAFMYVGFKFVAARGNTQELASARQAFFYTVIGTLLILGAQLIASILSGTLREITRDVF